MLQIQMRILRVFGLSKAEMNSIIENAQAEGSPSLRLQERDGEYLVCVQASAPTQAMADEYCEKWVQKLRTRFGDACYGFEGEAYTLDAQGEPEFTDLVTQNPDGREPVEALASLSINYFVWNSNPNIELELQGEAYQTLYDIWGKQDGNDWNYPTTATMAEAESTEFASVYSDIETYVREQTLRWICGEITLDQAAFDEFKENIEGMNIAACLENKQTAYDRYTQRGA